jgi:predicted dehydrogenase
VEFGVGHVYEIADFVRAVRDGRPAPVPGADGRHLMAVLEAAYASARDGGEVPVADGPPSYASEALAGSLLYQRLPA